MKKNFAICFFFCAFFSAFSLPWELDFRYDRWGDICESFYEQGDEETTNGKVYAINESPQDISASFFNYDATPDCLTIVSKTTSDFSVHPGQAESDEKVVVTMWRNDRIFSFYGINRAKLSFQNQIGIDVVAPDMIDALRENGAWAIMVQGENWHFCSTIDGNLPGFEK